MKVFLSWSKTRSRRVAELLGEWIPCVIQSIDPWVSSQNIEDGELWFSAIQTQIAQIINGVICLTHENKSEPWILFEAGGLARGLEKNRVYVLLIDLRSEDILLSPLAGFNHTRPDEEGIRKLLGVINNRTERPVSPQLLDKAFTKFWPDFKSQFDIIIDETKTTEKTETKSKAVSEIENDLKPLLEEILKNVRSSDRALSETARGSSLSYLRPKSFTIKDKQLYRYELTKRYLETINQFLTKHKLTTRTLDEQRNTIMLEINLKYGSVDEDIFNEAITEARVRFL
jgi:hypothetical protein